MRYLDKLLGEAKTKKSAFKTIEKIKKTKEKLVNRSIDAEDARDQAFDRGDDEEAYKQGDKHNNAMQRSARLSVFADKVKKGAHLKGGGKGDGKPQGKLRKVEHAAYMQIGFLISEIGDAAELDMAAAEKTVERGDRWYNWLKKNMNTAPKRKVTKATDKLRQAGVRADKDMAQAARSSARKAKFLSQGGQKLV